MLKRLLAPFSRYSRWLHTRWPAGSVERLPEMAPDGSTNVPGLYIVGDLTGIPLLKFSAQSGARAVRTILGDRQFQAARGTQPGALELVIVGGGVSGMAAALEARKSGLEFRLYEAKRPFQTVADFPRGKPIFTYPDQMVPDSELQFHAEVKEALLDELAAQTAEIEVRAAHVDRITRESGLLRVELSGGEAGGEAGGGSGGQADGESVLALRVIVAIGRSGNFRKLNVPGEELDKVHNRLHDPKEYCRLRVLVIGGGDSALETSIALAQCGAEVVHSYRKPAFARPKPDNLAAFEALVADPGADVSVERPVSERVTTAAGPFLEQGRARGSIRVELETRLERIEAEQVTLKRSDGELLELENDTVFSMIGHEAPLDFFRRSGVHISGEWTARRVLTMVGFLLLCLWVYHWKSAGAIPFGWELPGFLNPDASRLTGWLLSRFGDPAGLLGTLKLSASSSGFYYTLVYTLLIVIFGARRIRRRKTPYVRVQTLTLMAVQIFPLFLLPELLLPWLGHNGAFDGGLLGNLADQLFPASEWSVHGREYWRAYGFILAWPLMVANWFTGEPLVLWLVIGFLQTFVLLPLLIYRFGKGVYCGWICSCGAMAETLGDAHRHKMPHGPVWNRFNMIGQLILAFAALLMLLKLLAWTLGSGSFAADWHTLLSKQLPLLNYKWLVDLMLAGVVGYGLYFWFSGRMWCRFACPLAALMHIYARFSRFRILAEKKKCISCNVCTSVCHQGIDIMNFANKGLPMADPQCVRCSACVSSCPTETLRFGQVDRAGNVISTDRLSARESC